MEKTRGFVQYGPRIKRFCECGISLWL